MKKSIALLLCLLCAQLCVVPYAAAESIEDIAQQILGAQQVDEVLATFATPAPAAQAEEAEQAAEAEPDGAEPAETEAPTLPEDAQINYKYSVQPIFPANQIEQSGAYKLLVAPGDRQTVEVEITNQGTGAVTINIYVAPAYTNSYGVIEYGTTEPGLLYDTGAPSFTDIVKAEVQTVELNWRESVRVPITIEVPEEPFEGTIAGGLVFEREPNETDMSGGGNMGFLYVNAFAVGMQLKESEALAEPVFELADLRANVETVFGTHMEVHVGNATPMLLQDMSIEAQVFAFDDEGNLIGEPIATNNNDMISFAPYSIMPYQVNSGWVEPGEYKVIVTLADADGNTYEMEKTFTVSDVTEQTDEEMIDETEAVDDDETAGDDQGDNGTEEPASGDADDGTDEPEETGD